MTLDPDGCTFWYTNEYYQVDGLNDNTRVGAFSFSQCSPVGSGTLLVVALSLCTRLPTPRIVGT